MNRTVMMFSFIRKGVSVVAMLVLLVGIVPQAAFAAYLGAPTNVEVASGTYTIDSTPTFTWSAPSGATWYEYALDTSSMQSLGNVLSYTSSTLASGWHTFYVRAHDNSGNTSSTASVTFEIDTTGPTVPSVSPSTATEDASVTFSVTPYGESAPASCVLYVDSASVGSMTRNGSTFTKSYTFSWDGTYTVYARCTDGDGNVTNGTSRVVTVYDVDGSDDDDTFTVPAVSPSSATEDEAVVISVTPYGTLDAEACNLYVSGSYVGSMADYSGTFKRTYTFSNDGSFTVYAYCKNENNTWVLGTSRTVTVSEADEDTDDEDYPTVPAVSPSRADEDEEVTITVEPEEDDNGDEVRWCDLYVDGSNVGDMDEDDGEFSIDYTFRNSGSYTVYATCTDEDYDTTRGTSRTITVSEQDEDDDFTVPAVSPSSATEDESTEFSVEPYGDLEAETCKLYVDGSNVGTMSEDDGEFSRNYTFSNDGDYTVYAYCEDENGDWHKGSSRTVDVDEEDDNDDDDNSDELEVPEVTPSSAEEDEDTEFTVRPSGDNDVTSCWLYVDGTRVASMDEESRNKFVAEYEFTRDGSYSVYAVCKDSSGDQVTGDKRTVRVSDEDDNDNDDDAEEGSLIKISCGASSTVSDPCRAVYYYGEDGKRHAFPNESTFYTWYADFDDVVEVSSSFMSSITVGENVTYRPGSVLVKFESSSAVYAIEAERTLRQYKTWSLLESDYGDDAADYIVVLPDSLYSSYDLGTKIDSNSDFDRTDAYYSVDGIEDLF